MEHREIVSDLLSQKCSVSRPYYERKDWSEGGYSLRSLQRLYLLLYYTPTAGFVLVTATNEN